MVAGQDQDKVRVTILYRVKILIDGISRSLVPIGADPLLGGNNVDELPQLARKNIPAGQKVLFGEKKICTGSGHKRGAVLN